ncbi:MAG: twin-arginine translocation signal domain-containing protein, partial [Agromyces sp.]|nr:twin-arginine translocation signal domain-containing protein [Agromyces sp.]
MTRTPHTHPEPSPRWCSCAAPDDEVETTTSGLSRRNLLVGASAAGVLAAAGWPGAAQAAPGDDSVTITIMGTSDLHANAVNWDYYKDAVYSDSSGNAIGLARVSSVVNEIRAK